MTVAPSVGGIKDPNTRIRDTAGSVATQLTQQGVKDLRTNYTTGQYDMSWTKDGKRQSMKVKPGAKGVSVETQGEGSSSTEEYDDVEQAKLALDNKLAQKKPQAQSTAV